MINTHRLSLLQLFAGVSMGATVALLPLPAKSQADLTSSYSWKQVRLGAGGFVTGFVTHPLNSAIRYCRTDVGNAYRWDNVNSVWAPMVVKGISTGMPASLTAAPAGAGVESIALDPNNANIVYLSCQASHSYDVKALFPDVPGNVYRSIDGGVTFTAGNLAIPLSPNDEWRIDGERMMVDPANSNVIYYGSHSGLYRSLDSGSTWTLVTLSGSNVLSAQFSKADGVTTLSGKTVSKVLFATVANGSVFQSPDGGVNWNNISTGFGIDGKVASSTIDSSGALYVVQNYSQTLWKYKTSWVSIGANFPNGQNLQGVGVSRTSNNLLWAVGAGGALSRSNNAGASWTPVSQGLNFSNSFAWLPQSPGWRSNGGITFDANGKLWICQGNEGMLGYVPTNAETTANPPSWAIDSKGIEEFVTHDAILPPGGKLVVAVEDSTALVVTDPLQYTAKQVPLQDQLISNGTGLAYCPNAINYLVCASADVNRTSSGANYSGYSIDGGLNWQKFASYPYDPEGSYVPGVPLTATLGTTVKEAGSIAVSRRGSWTQGNDHLVWLPTNNFPPYFSSDGGKTWTRCNQFALTTHTEASSQWGPYVNSIGGLFKDLTAYWTFALKQRQVAADPFVADRFYMGLTWDGLYLSVNGGQSWTKTGAGLPRSCHHGQLATNMKVQNDLWYVDGWEGAEAHGIYHSTDGGANFTKIPGVDNAITLALGAGSGVAGAQPYTIYFYGKLANDNNWGVFSSTNGGSTWNRISFYPMGLFDVPTCMTASWDTYGTVYVGLSGNSFVYGVLGGTSAGTNVVLNPSFDSDASDTHSPANWPAWQPAGQSGAGYTETYGGAHSGARHYTHFSTAAYYINSYQNLSALPNGTYTLSCWTKSSGGQNSALIAAQGYGGSYVSKNIPASSVWTQVTITGIVVTNGTCQINLTSDAKAGNYVYFDDVTFIKQ